MNYRFIFRDIEPTQVNFLNILKDLFENYADEAMRVYNANSDEDVIDVATDLAGDRFAGFNTWKWLELHRQTGNSPVYRYYYSRPRPILGSEMQEEQTHITGAVHSAEIEYAMGNLSTNRVYNWQADDYKVSAIMQGFFVNFIKTHNPNGIGLPEWPSANENIDIQMRIDVKSKAEIDPHAQRYHWLNQLPGKYVSAPE
jgi:para-nitrobenzyl esterase